MELGKPRLFEEHDRLVVIIKRLDTLELLLLVVAAVIMFLLGWAFGRSSTAPTHHAEAPVYGRFGDLQQHTWIY